MVGCMPIMLFVDKTCHNFLLAFYPGGGYISCSRVSCVYWRSASEIKYKMRERK
jgi:hypothetical protein